jgi:glutathione S-transferase
MSSWTAIVTCLALSLYIAQLARVAQARRKYRIEPPATTGNPVFERIFRVQANTGEQLLLFLPGLWLFSFYLSGVWAAIIGLVWIAGRIAYAAGYEAEPRRRGLGFVTSMAASVILLAATMIVILLHLVQQAAG